MFFRSSIYIVTFFCGRNTHRRLSSMSVSFSSSLNFVTIPLHFVFTLAFFLRFRTKNSMDWLKTFMHILFNPLKSKMWYLDLYLAEHIQNNTSLLYASCMQISPVLLLLYDYITRTIYKHKKNIHILIDMFGMPWWQLTMTVTWQTHDSHMGHWYLPAKYCSLYLDH